ncbi:hypothetical protein CSKR_104091 [Clonorchis sinensis]|uniref:Uncharacterized protein n=1 Tax=Clonorchis sinensis TaxID=79923 RepID=A0A419QB56_CLOSI|nr:hypothetical protein CSKR_104091 [Clonorchis sinensis]
MIERIVTPAPPDDEKSVDPIKLPSSDISTPPVRTRVYCVHAAKLFRFRGGQQTTEYTSSQPTALTRANQSDAHPISHSSHTPDRWLNDERTRTRANSLTHRSSYYNLAKR